MVKNANEKALEQEVDSDKLLSSGINLMLSVIIIGTLLVGGLLFGIASNILSRIKNFSDVAFELSAGEADLSKRINVTSSDEIDQASGNFNLLLDKVAQIALNAQVHAQNAELATQEASKNLNHSGILVTLSNHMSRAKVKSSLVIHKPTKI